MTVSEVKNFARNKVLKGTVVIIVSFQYPEKAVKPADENQPTNRIAWLLNEEEE